MSKIPTTVTMSLAPSPILPSLRPALPQSTKRGSFQTMEIVAIVGVSCIIIAIISLTGVVWARRRMRRRDRLYPVDEDGRGVVADSSFSSATTKASAYFPARISLVYKDATPLLDHTPLRDMGKVQPVRNKQEMTEESFLHDSFPEDKEWSRRLPLLVIPRSTAALPHSRSLDSPAESSPTESLDTPSIYSQPSAYPSHLHSPPLSRGPSSRAAGRVPYTEHPLPPLPPLSSFFEDRLSTVDGLVRENTAHLLISRQQKQADRFPPALSSNPSIVSHIERSGSIIAAASSFPTVGNTKRVIDHEPYGRRVRRMRAKRNQENLRLEL